MTIGQALVGLSHPRRAMTVLAHSTWIQMVVPIIAELSFMFPAVYGPSLTEAWLGLPLSWGPAKVFCSLSTSDSPAPTFWIAVFLPDLPVYSATTGSLPPFLTLAFPQWLWIPLLNFELTEWLGIVHGAIHFEIISETFVGWGLTQYTEPILEIWAEIFRCLADCVFLASITYTATIGRLLALFAASLGAITGLLGDLWLDFGHACLQFDSAILTSALSDSSPSMIVM